MTVYVDDMYLYPIGEYKAPFSGRTMKMSHMIADTHEELVEMARAIGLNPRHIQKRDTHGEHFDICLSYRKRAIAAGAVQITMRQCSAMCIRRRVAGELGQPEDAEAWREAHAAMRRAAA
ncbi:hypothetical protein DC1_00037 [Burkholderia phage DC1]|uniref:DUF4031 domain-containing protein n=1 Tax=Burkholderia phage DC1 TaxID=2881398 RepID=I6NVN0_9CAUD|nr:hypothetical protein B862_gp46 [Burkholderia phage DC1]AEZ50855.1 hypothetical protein DC1_00037 [Burkholderia phage DC1]